MSYYPRIHGIVSSPLNVASIFDDWFLLSKDELNAVWTELALHGLGGFSPTNYWSSSEYNSTKAWAIDMSNGIAYNNNNKGPMQLNYVRACRAFTSTTNYNLRDIGPAGGYIFWKSGNNYLEAAPIDQADYVVWSNINNQLIGTTGTAIGTGASNTAAIIAQTGHTASAAKLCDDLII